MDAFQSTPPARGATAGGIRGGDHTVISIHAPREGGDDTSSRLAALTENFNPRPPRGGRPHSARLSFSPARFQSTPPARGATPQIREGIVLHVFQSTPPARGATQHIITHRGFRHISIHAPREGGDIVIQIIAVRLVAFQSTPPARGATESLHPWPI